MFIAVIFRLTEKKKEKNLKDHRREEKKSCQFSLIDLRHRRVKFQEEKGKEIEEIASEDDDNPIDIEDRKSREELSRPLTNRAKSSDTVRQRSSSKKEIYDH